jgi:peroxiredoxin
VVPPGPARRRGWLVPLAIAALIAAWIGITLIGGRLLPEGSAAPGFSLPRVGGGTLSLEELKGQVVVLDFWSIGCPPCLEELPTVASLWRRMEPRGVVVVGINAGGETAAEAASFARERGIDWPLAIDEDGAVSRAYRVTSLPAFYVIDRAGNVAAAHSGRWSGDGLRAAVEAALGKIH